MDDSKDEKIMKQSLDDLKDEVHIKPSCNVPDKLFETESDNSDTEMIPMIPLSPIDGYLYDFYCILIIVQFYIIYKFIFIVLYIFNIEIYYLI